MRLYEVMRLTVLLEWYCGSFVAFYEEKADDIMFWRALV
jgi:hypothetical protein